MRPIDSRRALAIAAGLLAGAACVVPVSAARPEVADLAARIEFGFYSGDAALVTAARSALRRLPEHDADVRYYRAYAAFRIAQLRIAGGSDAGDALAECVALSEPNAVGRDDIELAILRGMCAMHAARAEPLLGVVHQRRRDQALERARAIDSENPRLKLLEAWLVSLKPATAEPDVRAAAVRALEDALAAFALESVTGNGPGWGEVEALTALGEARLAADETQAARDLIERALLLAPDYRVALAQRERLLALH